MNVKVKLENFAKISEEEAENRRIEILKEIDEKVNKAVNQQENIAKDKASKDINEYRQKCNSRFNAETVAFRSAARLELLKVREELSDKVYISVRDKLIKYTDSGEYLDYLARDINYTTEGMHSAEVYLTEKDMSRLDEFKGRITSADIKFKASKDFIGGFKAYIPEKSISVDRTFVTKLSDNRENFSVMKIVMREA